MNFTECIFDDSTKKKTALNEQSLNICWIIFLYVMQNIPSTSQIESRLAGRLGGLQARPSGFFRVASCPTTRTHTFAAEAVATGTITVAGIHDRYRERQPGAWRVPRARTEPYWLTFRWIFTDRPCVSSPTITTFYTGKHSVRIPTTVSNTMA
jgi:hypothetical protein